MELRQLRYFVAVGEERHFGRAAERLGIAQSGLSQQIKALERSVRVRLVDRTARPVRLTPAGEAFLDEARRVLELADRAIARARTTGAPGKTVIRFGTSSFGNGPVITELLRVANEHLPDVEVQVQLDTTVHQLSGLYRRELDVAFVYRPFESPREPEFLPMGAVEIRVAVPEASGLAAFDRIPRAELMKEPLLMGPRSINPPLYEAVHRALFGHERHPHHTELTDIGPARFQLVADGGGFTPIAVPTEPMLPIRGVAYRRVEDPPPILEYGLAWLDDDTAPALPVFIDLARTIAAGFDPSADGRSLQPA